MRANVADLDGANKRSRFIQKIEIISDGRFSMNLHQLRCFIAVAEELHFGRAAQKLGMMPSALGRHVRILEESLGTRLLTRTTRFVALTGDGEELLDAARKILDQVGRLQVRFKGRDRSLPSILRVGAIDSASAGLMPLLISDFRERMPTVTVQLIEDKTVKLIPKLLSGSLDLAIVRPPETTTSRLSSMFLFNETAVVAVPENHPLADHVEISIDDLAEQSMIVPDRRSRPHSHELTMNLFEEAGLQARVAQVAEEKHTIINLVAAGLGIAIVPRWTSRMAVSGARYVPLAHQCDGGKTLPLAAYWPDGARDGTRDKLLELLGEKISSYAEKA